MLAGRIKAFDRTMPAVCTICAYSRLANIAHRYTVWKWQQLVSLLDLSTQYTRVTPHFQFERWSSVLQQVPIKSVLFWSVCVTADCLSRWEQKLQSIATAVGAINFHQSGWSLCLFPLSPLSLLLEEDNEEDGELCNTTNTALLDRCIRFRPRY